MEEAGVGLFKKSKIDYTAETFIEKENGNLTKIANPYLTRKKHIWVIKR